MALFFYYTDNFERRYNFNIVHVLQFDAENNTVRTKS